ncbi:ATP-grasp domain-containing protein [Anoxybacterium hadale]|uniref:ATP-grasp domain-containing protein n=1 Tax=Anoxybacterium hadale TaxID=3408580 RepID=A0ACD1A7K0_9FIRM|nr:ATP-grasp domain-containing protein [Clostridiales bacterium]
MTRIAIIGGKLQGTEAAYLAKKAGFTSILIDRNENSPAIGLCDEFLCCDITQETEELIAALKNADFVLPANENQAVLDALTGLAKKHCFPLAFDPEAYRISSSKLLSDELMHANGIPAPKYYPDCSGPYIAKPSSMSGSEGVQRLADQEALLHFLKTVSESEESWAKESRTKEGRSEEGQTLWVIQEYLEGPSYSIEVIGAPGFYKTYEVTQIHMDEVYDCKMVTSPCSITAQQEDQFRNIAVKLAELTGLTGIMDVEVIDANGEFKVLEIDARIPSQTPTAVYHTSGVNFIEELRDVFCGEGLFPEKKQKSNEQKNQKKNQAKNTKKKFCSYEHLMINDGRITEHGEHIMGQGGILSLRERFYGADEVISDYRSGEQIWRGTFINWADTEEELMAKRQSMRARLQAGPTADLD